MQSSCSSILHFIWRLFNVLIHSAIGTFSVEGKFFLGIFKQCRFHYFSCISLTYGRRTIWISIGFQESQFSFPKLSRFTLFVWCSSLYFMFQGTGNALFAFILTFCMRFCSFQSFWNSKFWYPLSFCSWRLLTVIAILILQVLFSWVAWVQVPEIYCLGLDVLNCDVISRSWGHRVSRGGRW